VDAGLAEVRHLDRPLPADGVRPRRVAVELVGGKLDVTGGGGNDVVTVLASNVSGSVKASLGEGLNVLSFRIGSSFGGSIGATSGSGDDVLTLDAVAVAKNVKFTAGEGQNLVEVTQSNVAGKVEIRTGNGDDTIDLTNSPIGGAVTIAAGGGTNGITP